MDRQAGIITRPQREFEALFVSSWSIDIKKDLARPAGKDGQAGGLMDEDAEMPSGEVSGDAISLLAC
jgi:hypothetical protein